MCILIGELPQTYASLRPQSNQAYQREYISTVLSRLKSELCWMAYCQHSSQRDEEVEECSSCLFSEATATYMPYVSWTLAMGGAGLALASQEPIT